MADGQTRLIGFFFESLDDEHEVSVLQGAILGAREASVTLVGFAGGALSDPDPDRAARNFIFDLFADELDGVVALTSALASECGPQAAGEFVERLHHDNVVCAGVALPGFTSVEVDNGGGTEAAIQHLIEQHGAARIAYICGPQGSTEVRARRLAFEETLRAAGLAFDPRYLLQGDFSKASGAAAIATLLDEHRVSPSLLDAVVGGNDYMALGAMEELARRGHRVPQDVAVVGFDDVESARLVRPTLTTIAQPGAALGRASVSLAVEHAKDRRLKLETELVVRASCGCTELMPRLGMSVLPRSSSAAGSFVQRRQIIRAELVRSSRGLLGAAGRDWEARLLDALIGELRGAQQGQLNGALSHILGKVDLDVICGGVVQELLSTLRSQALLCLDDSQMRHQLESLLHDARAYAAAFASAALSDRARGDADKQRSFQRAVRRAMFGAADELSQAAAAHLPEFGVSGVIVAALDTPGELDGPARVLMGFGPAGRLARPEATQLKALLHHPLIERLGRTLIVLPVVAEGQALGVALVSARSIDGAALEDFADSLAAIMRGARNARWTVLPQGQSTPP